MASAMHETLGVLAVDSEQPTLHWDTDAATMMCSFARGPLAVSAEARHLTR